MNIGSIFVALGFKTNTKDLNTFNAGIKSLTTNILATSIAFTGAVYSVKKFLDSGISTASVMTNFANQTGLAINKLNQFTSAGQSISLSLNSEGIANDIMNLEKSIARIRIGQGSIAPFQRLGINVLESDAFNVLEQIRENIKGLDDITATILIEDLGLNPNFLQILKLSNEEFTKLGKNNFLNGNQAKLVNQLGLNIRKLSTEFENLKNQAIVKLTPYFNELINETFKWLKQNGDKIANTISDLAKSFGIFIQGMSNGVRFAAELLEKIPNIQNGFKVLAIAASLILMPFKKILIPLTLIFGLLEDIDRWKSGKSSAFGDIYQDIKDFLNGMKEVFKFISDNIKKILEFIDIQLGTNITDVAQVAGKIATEAVPKVIFSKPATNEEKTIEKANFAYNLVKDIFKTIGFEAKSDVKITNQITMNINGANASTPNQIRSEIENITSNSLKPSISNVSTVM